MRILVWLLRAALFFTLFAFALNNQHDSGIHWFFGYEWRAPMVFIVLAAFAFGCACGVFAMLPSWWRQRRVARQQFSEPELAEAPQTTAGVVAAEPQHPPRDGL